MLVKSVRLKEVDGLILQIYRHFDDVKMSYWIKIPNCLIQNEQLSSLVRMSDWIKSEKFVRCLIKYGDRVVLLRQAEYILETEARFHDYILPINPIR